MYLQIKQLNKSFGIRRVVSDVSLEMEEGEILSLLGPSGCGKTTILRMLAGLETPDSGMIEMSGRMLYDGKHEMPVEERDLGMVFQDYALWPHMTVAQNVSFGLNLRRVPGSRVKQRVLELLELVNLSGMGDRFPFQLSGGQQQRVAIARALATEPRVILLDEPLSSLDTALRKIMAAELVQLFKRLKITAINVTHDQDEAMTMSDRIMVLRDGRVQQVGTPTALYLTPVNAFVSSFMGAANMLPGKLVRTDGEKAIVRLDSADFADKDMVGMVGENVRERLEGNLFLMCRPDDIRVYSVAPSEDKPNILTGNVSFSSFVGGRWRTTITVGNSLSRNIQAFASTHIQPQKQVWLEFPPERCLIVPE